jgi:hypothetical protein
MSGFNNVCFRIFNCRSEEAISSKILDDESIAVVLVLGVSDERITLVNEEYVKVTC